LICLLATTKNTSLDYQRDGSEDSSGESASASEVDPDEILAKDVESVVEKIKGLHKLLEECQGKLASDGFAQPLPYVLADAIDKFLDNKMIVIAALDVIAKMWDNSILKEVSNIPSMPTFKESVNKSVRTGMMVFGSDWLQQSKSWSTLGGLTNIGPDRVTQVMLDRHLATARRLMEADLTQVREHEVVQCAVLLNSVVCWHLMTTAQEEYYAELVSMFALWLVNSFQTREREKKHVGVLGCELLYHIAVRNMEVDPVQFAWADQWFRKNKIPERLMAFQGFSEDGNKFIAEIMRRVPADAVGPIRRVPPDAVGPLPKRIREPFPAPSPADAAPAARGLSGSA